jgi:hypothetical protein
MASVPAAGQTIKASDVFTMSTYTPTLSNITAGSGATNEGWYQQIGNAVFWAFRLEFGTSPALSTSASALVSMPVTAFTGGASGLQLCLGAWVLRTGTNSHYAGSMGAFESAGINACFDGAWNDTATITNERVGGRGTTIYPEGVVIAATNVLSGSGWYRAA